MKRFLLLIMLGLSVAAYGDEITCTGINFAHSSFSASDTGLTFGNPVNVLCTNNTTGKDTMLISIQSGSTGAATAFAPGPPLVADYSHGGADSVLIASGGTTFLSGIMEDSGRLEAEYPDRAGAFLSRFTVTFVNPIILTDLGLPSTTRIAPEGSVSLTVGETSFTDGILSATLGGSQITIETEPAVPETATLILFGTGILAAFWSSRNRMKSTI